MAHYSVAILHLSWHTPWLLSSLLCHWCCYDFAVSTSLLTQGDRMQNSQLNKDKDQAQHSFHKTSAHSTEHGSHRQCPSLLFWVEAQWESKKPRRLPPRRPASQSLQLCKVGCSVVGERPTSPPSRAGFCVEARIRVSSSEWKKRSKWTLS